VTGRLNGCLRVQCSYPTATGVRADLLLEESLAEMEVVVRGKLGLPENASIGLAQIREGQLIDLEDGRWKKFYYLLLSFQHCR
jgi:hypothetical protein